MWSPQKKENEDKTLGNFPNVCAEQPAPGSAFCPSHSKAVKDLGYPCGLRKFLIKCGANPGNYTKEAKKQVRCILEQLSKEDTTEMLTQSGADMQGTSFLLENKNLIADSGQMEEDSKDKRCTKDVGEIFRLHNWSRGIQVIVGAGGQKSQKAENWTNQTTIRGCSHITSAKIGGS